MALPAGTRLGPYEILEPLGAGGMGEVYRAHDTKLDRDVALKVLPEGALADEEARRRFRREANALSRLSHPHVATLFDFDTADGTDFLVMELVRGPSVQDELEEKGALPERDVVRLGGQLARGLQAAHEQGIVHRDLKPGNLQLTPDGLLKILDFGLARLLPKEPAAGEETAPTQTAVGRVAGTLLYMSPEQLRGRGVDARTDLYAAGAVLYEMATGRRLFSKPSSAELTEAILNEDPTPPRALNERISPGLEAVILKALDKDPELRYQTAKELLVDLERLQLRPDSRSSGRSLTARAPECPAAGLPARGNPPGRVGGRWGALLGAGLLLAGLGGLGWWLVAHRIRDPSTTPVKVTPFTADGGLKAQPRLSPDGDRVAYIWAGRSDDNWDIYVKALAPGSTPLRLTQDPADDKGPAWSPDGQQVAFVRLSDGEGAVYTVPSTGGQERKLADVAIAETTYDWLAPDVSWSADGQWLAYSESSAEGGPSRIVRLSLETLETQLLTFPPDDSLGDFQPRFSPDGTHLAFVRSGSIAFGDLDLWVQPAEGGAPRRLTFGQYNYCFYSWASDGGEVVYLDDMPGGLLRVSAAGGTPRSVTGPGQDGGGVSVRADRMVYVQMTPWPSDIWRVPGRKASPAERVASAFITSTRSDGMPSYSPDGQKIAFVSGRTGVANVWVSNSDGSHAVQLTWFEKGASSPRWSPDGRTLVLHSLEAGDWNVYTVDADGGRPRRVTPEISSDLDGSWSRDGRWIYFQSDRGGHPEIWRIPAGGGAATQVTQGGGTRAEESWDGRDLYYMKGRRLWRRPVEGGLAVEVGQDTLEGTSNWALTRNGIYYAVTRERGAALRHHEYSIRYLDLQSSEVSELFRTEGPFHTAAMAVSPDEEWILFARNRFWDSELMLVDSFR